MSTSAIVMMIIGCGTVVAIVIALSVEKRNALQNKAN